MIKELDSFYLSRKEPSKSVFLAIRTIIINHDENISEDLKWGMPCFLYKKKMFCFLWEDKKTEEPYILWVEGKHLEHPKLEKGDRSRMKIFRIDSNADLPLIEISTLLQQALDLYKKGVIKIK